MIISELTSKAAGNAFGGQSERITSNSCPGVFSSGIFDKCLPSSAWTDAEVYGRRQLGVIAVHWPQLLFLAPIGRAAVSDLRPLFWCASGRDPSIVKRSPLTRSFVFSRHFPHCNRFNYSILILADRMTLAHFSVSPAMSFPNCADVIGSGRTPKLTRRPRVSGSPTMALISL